MEPRFEQLPEIKLVGMRLTMSHGANRTFELWRGFMPRRREITNNLSQDLYSMQVYTPGYDFSRFNPDSAFDKWAAVEVHDFSQVPAGMETFVISAGLYAVFIHRGAASEGPRTFGYIFGTWLPASEYQLDHRPHFEVLGEKYKNEDPVSEEEVWIPVRPKK